MSFGGKSRRGRLIVLGNHGKITSYAANLRGQSHEYAWDTVAKPPHPIETEHGSLRCQKTETASRSHLITHRLKALRGASAG